MLEIAELTVAYGGVVALNNLSLIVAEGSITTVLGANGAGKTTLVRTISGLVKARAGSVRVAGTELKGRAPEDIARLGVAHVPEGHGIISEITVDENLRLGGLWRRDRADQRLAIEEAYELFPRWWRAATCTPPASPGASARCSPSVARSPHARECCCSTNPRWDCTRPCSRRSWTGCARSAENAGSRCC